LFAASRKIPVFIASYAIGSCVLTLGLNLNPVLFGIASSHKNAIFRSTLSIYL